MCVVCGWVGGCMWCMCGVCICMNVCVWVCGCVCVHEGKRVLFGARHCASHYRVSVISTLYTFTLPQCGLTPPTIDVPT